MSASPANPSKPAGPGKRPELKWLPVARCSVDHRYQRTLESDRSQKLIQRIADSFHWSAFQAVLATKRPPVKGEGGGWLIIDGQHRVEAARRRGEMEVPAVVVEASTMAEQAAAFVRSNTDRVQINPFALHRASVQGEDPRALAIDRLCKAAGIEIPPYPLPADKLKPGQTLALATIAKLPARFGDDIAELALKTVARAYAGKSGALRAPVIQAVAMLLQNEIQMKRTDLARRIEAHLGRGDAGKLAIKALERRHRVGGTEIQSSVYLIGEALKQEARFERPAAEGSAIRPLTKDQLMRGR